MVVGLHFPIIASLFAAHPTSQFLGHPLCLVLLSISQYRLHLLVDYLLNPKGPRTQIIGL